VARKGRVAVELVTAVKNAEEEVLRTRTSPMHTLARTLTVPAWRRSHPRASPDP
jgi:hypothetical protein